MFEKFQNGEEQVQAYIVRTEFHLELLIDIFLNTHSLGSPSLLYASILVLDLVLYLIFCG